MKKLVSTLAILAALVAFCAPALAESAAAWSNGQSPAQPYKGVPPVNLSKKLGYMVLDPLNNENADGASGILRIYLPRVDVKAGAGSINVYEEGAKSPLETIVFDDSSRVTMEPIGAEDLAWLYWESGVCFTVRLDNSLDADKTYYATLEEGTILATDYEAVTNTLLDGRKGWTFTTNTDAGVTARRRSGGDMPKVGDDVTVEVKLGGAVASATIFCDTDAVTSDGQPLNESGELTAHYAKAGLASWGIALMDESGTLITAYRYVDDVQP